VVAAAAAAMAAEKNSGMLHKTLDRGFMFT